MKTHLKEGGGGAVVCLSLTRNNPNSHTFGPVLVTAMQTQPPPPPFLSIDRSFLIFDRFCSQFSSVLKKTKLMQINRR